MARLLIPNLGPDLNLRQVLNDEQAFRKVFLSKKKERHFSTLPTLTRTDFHKNTPEHIKNTPQLNRRLSVKKNPEDYSG